MVVVVVPAVVGGTIDVVERGATVVGRPGSVDAASLPTVGLMQEAVTTSTTKAGVRRDIEGHIGMYRELPA